MDSHASVTESEIIICLSEKKDNLQSNFNNLCCMFVYYVFLLSN